MLSPFAAAPAEAQVPAAPQNLRTRAGDGNLGVIWTRSAETLTGYDLHYTSNTTVTDTAAASGSDATAAWVAATGPPASADFQTLLSLTNGRRYRVRLRAKNSSGAGPWAFTTGTPGFFLKWPSATYSQDEGNTTAHQARLNPSTPSRNVSGTLTYAAGATNGASLSADLQSGYATSFAARRVTERVDVTVALPVNDTVNEEDETFTVKINAGTNYLVGTPATLTVTITDNDPPAAPSGLSVKAGIGTGKLRASWTKPVGPVTGYQLRHKETTAQDHPATTDPSNGWVTQSITTTTADISGLTSGTEYHVQVRATDGQTGTGNGWGAWSASQTGTGPSSDTFLARSGGLTVTSSTSASGTFTAVTLGAVGGQLQGTVPNSHTHAKITPTVNHSGATVKVGKQGTTLATVTSGTASGAIPLTVGANVIEVEVTAEDGTTTNTTTVTITRGAAPTTSSDATLSGLTATTSASAAGTFTSLNIGTFAAATTSYTATVANSRTHAKLTPTVNHSSATVTVAGTAVTSGSASGAIALSVGANAITVRVTAQDGTTTKDYTVTITREAAQSSNANLSGLTATTSTSSTATFTSLTLTPSTFSATTTSYTATVANARTHAKLTPTVAHSSATVTVGGTTVSSGSASGAIALSVGANAITVKVTAQDGTTTKDYTVTITREAAQSTNANLSGLTATTSTSSTATFTSLVLTPSTFSATTTSYTATVANARTHAKVTPTVAHSSATVTVAGTTVSSGSASGAIALSVGSNAITVRVTAQDGTTTKNYTVTITREPPPSSNANLSGLTTTTSTSSTGTFTSLTLTPSTFSATTTSYTATVANGTTHAKVTPTVAQSSATVTVAGTTVSSGSASGAIALSVGSNAIAVRVTAQDGTTTKDYTVTITRQAATALPAVSLSASPNPVTEGSSVTVTVQLSAAPSSAVTIPLTVSTTSPNTAESGDVGTLTSITVNAGATSGTGTVTTSEDDDASDETFAITLGTLPASVETGTPNSVQVTIQDTVSVVAASVSASPNPVNEGSPVTVTATLTVPSEEDLRIPMTVAQQTAEPGDYEAPKIFYIDFPAGETTGTYDIQTVHDDDEDLEQFLISVAGGWRMPPGVKVGAPGSVRVSIVDKDANPHVISVSDAELTEKTIEEVRRRTGDPRMRFQVTLSHAAEHVIWANYWTEDGTAKAGLDYRGVERNDGANMAVVFEPGVTHQELRIRILDDDVEDSGETFSLVLANPEGAVLGKARGTGTILNDEKTSLSRLVAEGASSEDGPFAALDIGSFAPGTKEYSVSVPNGTTHARLTAETSYAYAVVRIGTEDNTKGLGSGGGTGPVTALAVGENVLLVKTSWNSEKAEYRVKITREERTASSDADLSGLSAEGGADGDWSALDIGTFSAATTAYTATVPHGTTQARLTATVADANATLKVGSGSSLSAGTSGAASAAIALEVGTTALSVQVTAEDGTTKSYAVMVTREARPSSSNAALAGLTAEAGSSGSWSALNIGTFSATTTAYTATVAHGTTHARLTATAADANATLKAGTGSSLSAVTSGAASSAIALEVGANAISVEVTAEDGTKKTYSVTVTREARASSSNANLTGLSAEAGWNGSWSALNIGTFSAATTQYSATVPNGTTQARLTATTADANATLRVGSGSSLSAVSSGSASAAISLDVGANALSVEVTAENGTTKTYAVRVERSAPPKPLTAAFENVPDEHDGKAAFTVDVRFSEALGTGAAGPTAASFDRYAGTVEEVEDLGSGVWRVTVQPGSWRDVTVGLTGGRDCNAGSVVCTADGRALENTVEASVGGPVRIRIQNGKAREGQDAGIDFVVTLNRASTEPVSVDYATADGTAKAGEDYEAVSGTLTFAAGETEKTVHVTILDDDVDEGNEKFEMRLSNESGAYLRGTHKKATGTIRNTDLIPGALLARFGRATAEQVVTHIEERMAAPRRRGFRARFAGRELRPGQERDFALGLVSQFAPIGMGSHAAGAGAFGISTGGMSGAMGMNGISTAGGGMGMTGIGAAGGAMGMNGMSGMPGAMGMTGQHASMGGYGPADGMHAGGLFGAMGMGGDLFSSSELELNRESRGGMLSLWSRSSRSHFSGMEDALSLNGDVRTTMVGADYSRGALTIGLSVGRTLGLGGYRGTSGGQMSTSMTGVYPWVGYQVNDRVSVWGTTGYGTGALSLTPDAASALETGVSMMMSAVGTRGELLGSQATGGFALAFKADALWVGAASDLVEGPAGRLNASEAAVTRVRTALEGSRGFTLGGGRLSLRPSVEVGVRRDGGDAETGAGMDVGGGLVLSDTVTGLSLDVRMRTLVVHQAEGFSERGLSLSFGWDATPSSPLGLTARVAPSWGGSAQSGAEALWGGQTAYGMGSHQMYGAGGQVAAEVGYGLPVGARLIGTPRVGLTTSEYGRDYRVGYGLGVLDRSKVNFELGVDAQRRESPMHGEASNGFMTRATLGW